MSEARLIEARDGLEIVDNGPERRYEARLDGALAGVLEYLPRDGWLILDHTEVSPGFEGRGIASRLAKVALDDVRARDLLMTPSCPFVAAHVKRHPAYADLVVGIRGPRRPRG